MKLTIREIAKMAGVSPGTVSKVINQTGSISPNTIQKVKRVIEDTGYQPSFSAKALATKKSNMIGLIYAGEVHVEFNHPFFNQVINAFKNSVGQLGYDLLVFSNQSFNIGKEDYVARAKHYQLDGCLIIAGEHIEEAIYQLDQSDIPTVAVDLELSGERSSYVMADNEKISRQVVEYFYLNGIRKVAFIGGQEDSVISNVRKEAFEQSMKDYGMDLRNEWIKYGNYFEESGYQKMKEIIESGHIPDAVYAVSDMMALGVIKAIKEAGFSIPNDIKVIGCDDIEACRYSDPALATVKQDQVKIGRLAANILHDLISERTVQKAVYVDPELIIRRSSEM
ncbi:LacI family transcriptional regulator [Gracilibacillus caseinilyticus]|uniref:LacI family transcriptional regulator n=1 Tax=Gracilibacillus caseinilyticus TaxID=2932256 RepID=A0ABY4EWW4_9BACI|nr:LacI family DNA-binding transcriptional regulator [Gracilibacillus caseinilyticus]UOQ48333.1 LacI family transcriptional regulator [Gracilibacillus caseinilyticus]